MKKTKIINEEKFEPGTVLNWDDFISKRIMIEDFTPLFLKHTFYEDGAEVYTLQIAFPNSTRQFCTLVSKLDAKYVDHFFSEEESMQFIHKGIESLEYVGIAVFDKLKGRDGLVWHNMQFSRAEVSDMADKLVKAWANAPKIKVVGKDGK